MKAPPRSTVAPAFFTANAVSISWVELSMAQGPAMTVRFSGPTEVLDRDTEDGSG